MTEQELIRRFHQALAEIAQLAGAIGEQHWQQAFFDKARHTLANEALLARERLRLACEQSHVFGGMGSWNDSPPFSAAEHGLLEEFEQTTAVLYEIRSAAIVHLRRRGRGQG
ncbi:NADH dehydrogenase [Eikenella sp. NML01-A-086]|uniref:NADH dehydrogenase n=1 Tax=Eikenella sp. NML01-A-086 TaxID=1795826 RepID=UPI0007E17C98|nr:NADH dehydrogenase [Eikenella sp. NML01-A-086]OAM25856.1 NADH dehydrogenase [Eikenella sp. NML01-A-086]